MCDFEVVPRDCWFCVPLMLLATKPAERRGAGGKAKKHRIRPLATGRGFPEKGNKAGRNWVGFLPFGTPRPKTRQLDEKNR